MAAGIDQLGGRIGLAALFTDVAVLIWRLAVGTRAANEAVRQKAAVLLAVRLLDVSPFDLSCVFETAVDHLGIRAIFLGVRRPKAIELNVEVFEIALMLFKESA